MTKVSDLKQEWMNDPGFRAGYEEADADHRIFEALIHARKRAGLTQSQLARRLKTTQSAIARLESGRGSTKLETLRRYVAATDSRLVVDVRPARKLAMA